MITFLEHAQLDEANLDKDKIEYYFPLVKAVIDSGTPLEVHVAAKASSPSFKVLVDKKTAPKDGPTKTGGNWSKEFHGVVVDASNAGGRVKKGNKVSFAWTNIHKTGVFSTGGSGAGAKLTKIVEAAQCVYCAAYLLDKNTEFTNADLIAADKSQNSWTTTPIDKILKIDKAWRASCIVIAKRVVDKYKLTKSIAFHHNTKPVAAIYAAFKRGNKLMADAEKQTPFARPDKWSPADIWVLSNTGYGTGSEMQSLLNEHGTVLAELNTFLKQEMIKKNIIGISLKKSPTAEAPPIKEFNTDGYKRPIATVNKITLSDSFTPTSKSFWTSSKDAYVHLTVGGKPERIQFRTFNSTRPSDWQGEVKGKHAAAGKIGGGLMRRFCTDAGLKFPNTTQTKKWFDASSHDRALAAKPNAKELPLDSFKLLPEIYSMMDGPNDSKAKAEFISNFVDAATRSSKRAANDDWLYCEIMSLTLRDMITPINDKVNDAFTDIFFYAYSATRHSAPFVKVGS